MITDNINTEEEGKGGGEREVFRKRGLRRKGKYGTENGGDLKKKMG